MIHEKAATGFQRASDSYEKGRPEYPESALEFWKKEQTLTPESIVVDLGAGTGKMTRLLCRHTRARLVAVEPVEGMRNKLHEVLPEIEIVPGTAEAMPFPDASVDAVVVAQAFHWFDGVKALQEIYRVLKPGGGLDLFWNVRDESVDWVAHLVPLMTPYEAGTPRFRTQKWREAFETTSLFSKLEEHHFPFVQEGDVSTIVDRILSVSFIAALPVDERGRVAAQVRELVETHSQTREQTRISIPHITHVYSCRKIGSR